MLTPEAFERVTASYRRGYYDGYNGREARNLPVPDWQGIPLKPFSNFDYKEGYKAGEIDRFNDDRFAILRNSRYVRCGDQVFKFPGSMAAVSATYRDMIDKNGWTGGGETGPMAPPCDILDRDEVVIAHVSYNGRVWAGPRDTWNSDVRALFDPAR